MKIVGLSQRRTRWGARVQAMAMLDDSARQVALYLRGEPEWRDSVARTIGHVDVGTTLAGDELTDAVIRSFERF